MLMGWDGMDRLEAARGNERRVYDYYLDHVYLGSKIGIGS